MPDDMPPPPPGVTLRDPEDSDALRKGVEDGVAQAMQRYVHGFDYGGVRLDLSNVHYKDKEEYSLAEQREALMADRYLARRLKADVKLVDTDTNKVLDHKRNLTLARVPYVTERGTAIHNGTEYALVSQSRLLPGAYTRRTADGGIECHVNTRPGTGPAMRVTLDPATAQMRLKIGTSDLHAYSVFKDMGVTDDEMERRWGRPVMEVNRSKYSKDAIDRAYAKAVPKWQRDVTLPREEKAKAVRQAVEGAQVATSILKRNLPNLYDREKSAAWRRAGIALDALASMEKSASSFAPDLSSEDMLDRWLDMEFDLVEAEKEAAFDPDLTPSEMRESYNSLYGKSGPRLASMRRWPAHWMDSQDTKGWLEWYQNYEAGRRTDEDERQIKRWESFKRRQGALFRSSPTPRRAFALINWAIDPLAMLPDADREAFSKRMDDYKAVEYVKWFMNRHDFDSDRARRIGRIAVSRGAPEPSDPPTAGELMTMATEGFIKPKDLQP